jgi:oligopeptide/dipeptide ABC transporter ATP-binding protein
MNDASEQSPLSSKLTPLLQVDGLVKHFGLKSPGIFGKTRGTVHALNNVSFEIKKGETLAIVGESGCGKSTLARVITGLYQADFGSIRYTGENFQKNVQMIFQDPYASLNPRLTVGDIIAEPLIIHKIGTPAEQQIRIAKILESVSLQKSDALKYPHQFSGGQRQRIAIARALISEPELIIADEPLSALDVSIQSQILNLLMKLKSERELTYLFISHDLATVAHIADRIIVMYLGKIVESGECESIFNNPSHPYTQALISSAPIIGKGKRRKSSLIRGESASPLAPPSGCSYHPRCSKMVDSCAIEKPSLQPLSDQNNFHQVSCPVSIHQRN